MNLVMNHNENVYFKEVTWMVTLFYNAHAESLTSHYLRLPSTEIPFPHDFEVFLDEEKTSS